MTSPGSGLRLLIGGRTSKNSEEKKRDEKQNVLLFFHRCNRQMPAPALISSFTHVTCHARVHGVISRSPTGRRFHTNGYDSALTLFTITTVRTALRSSKQFLPHAVTKQILSLNQ